MKSKVFFLPADRINNIDEFFPETGILQHFNKGDKVALKMHFGSREHKNTIPHYYLSGITNQLISNGCSPFLADTNVLYCDDRAKTSTHLQVARGNNYDKLGIPIIIAGGDSGEDYVSIKGKHKYYRNLFIAREFAETDGLLALTHFKGHGFAAIGGTIKNLAMGCASRKGKFAMHAKIKPEITPEKCIGCGLCVNNCPAKAISLVDNIATIDGKKCFGCAQCVHTCPEQAIRIPWSSISPKEFQEKIAEYALYVRNLYGVKFFAVNFLINITPKCDCEDNPGKPLVGDIGVLFSKDPVAIDRASLDMVAAAEGPDIPGGVEKFSHIRPGNHPYFQLNYAEKIGLGTNRYELLNL